MSTNPTKPFTGNFELQTRIRSIIQQLLAATIRKMCQFGQKVDKFEDYFVNFKQRVDYIENMGSNQADSFEKMKEYLKKIKQEISIQQLKNNENLEKSRIENVQLKEEMNQNRRMIKQNQKNQQNMEVQLLKNKTKITQYTNLINTMKEQVAYKITKYVEQTAQTNAQIKNNNEEIKKEYFNVCLELDKQKEKYDKIMLMRQENENDSRRIKQEIEHINIKQQQINQVITHVGSKMDASQTALYGKIKLIENKCQNRIYQLETSNDKILGSVKKVQKFSTILNEMKQQIDLGQHMIMKKIDDNVKRNNQKIQNQIIQVNKDIFKIQKNYDKKFIIQQQQVQKMEDFFTSKINYLKLEIQTELTVKTAKILQQKSKNQRGLANSTVEDINLKINKLSLQVNKSVIKAENVIKQELRKQITEFKQNIDNKLQSGIPNENNGGINVTNDILVTIKDNEQNLIIMKQNINKHQNNIQQLLKMKQNLEQEIIRIQKELKERINIYFECQTQKLNNRIQKVMFILTKIRGDTIIRNQYTDKELLEIKKNYNANKLAIETIFKIIPGLSQCINLILSLIFDAEYQHAKRIQQNIIQNNNQYLKFNTCCQGILYQFKQRKKHGIICYRHKQFNKIDIVRATFLGFITMWEELYQNDFQYMPKQFYRKMVEKNLPKLQKNINQIQTINKNTHIQIQTQQSNFLPNHKGQPTGYKIQTSQSPSDKNNDYNMNNSFHIRKKKNITLRPKEDIVMVVSETLT